MANINETVLDEKLTALEKVRIWSSRVISRLETMLRTADDYDLFRINPLQYAADRNMSENEAVDLFLHGTKIGLFEMDWHMICAYCAHVVESLRSMESLHSHFVCDVCEAVNDISMDDYIQVTFTISPRVRPITFHRPDSLPIDDFILKYQFAKGVARLPDGTTFAELAQYVTRLATYIQPREKHTEAIDLPPGRLHALDIAHKTGVNLWIGEDAHAAHPHAQNIPFHVENGKMHTPTITTAPQDVPVNLTTLKMEQLGNISNGKSVIEIANLSDRRIPVWVLHYPPGFQPFLMPFEPFLSGKKLLTTQTFRDLFRTETVQTTEGIGVKDITLLFTDLKGSTAMYDQIGDAKAYYLVRQHFDTLGTAVTRNNGAIVKTIGDAIMATFMNPKDAVSAGIEMIQELEAFNRSISQILSLKVGIHRGHSIVVTLNDRLDYFGQTVNIAARVQGLADADEIYVTHEAFDYPGVSEVLAEHHVTRSEVDVKGVSGRLDVYKITVPK